MIRKIFNYFFSLIPISVYVFLRHILEHGFKREARLINERIESAVSPILDVGCSSGELSFFPEESQIIGIEWNFSMIFRALRKGYKALVCGDIRHMPFTDASFPCVLICKTCHHLDDNEFAELLRETYRVLQDNGNLIILEPTPPSETTSMFQDTLAHLELGRHRRNAESMVRFLSEFDISEKLIFHTFASEFIIITCRK